MDESIAGPVNLVAPQPVTNSEFAKTLGKVISKPAFIPTPSLAIKTMYGEMGNAIILSSTRVIPLKLQIVHHQFSYPQLEPALRHLLGRTG
jgi:NAD dependent epimerase/dehydratase family enzyme